VKKKNATLVLQSWFRDDLAQDLPGLEMLKLPVEEASIRSWRTADEAWAAREVCSGLTALDK
jgi:hypothetical protein